MMKMLRRFSVILIVALIVSTITPISLYSHANATSTPEPGTVEYVSKVLDDYLEKKGIVLKKGTPEYVEYLTDMLMFEEDEELKVLPEYEDIKVYASNYIVEINTLPIIPSKDETPTIQTKSTLKVIDIPTSMKGKTIDELIDANIREDEQRELEIENHKESPSIQPMAAYSPSKAVAYAKKYGESHNNAYNYFSSKNCTNFVSQAVNAGGKSMTLPTKIDTRPKAYSTTSYWYNKLVDVGAGVSYGKTRKYSTAWTTVADFYTYWGKKGATRTSYTSKSSLQNNLKLGDIVQLYNGSTWYHSIIIVGGSKGNWIYAGNSRDTDNSKISSISGTTKYRIIRVK